MGGVILKAVLIVALPVAVFMGGSTLMARLSGRETVKQQLREKAEPRDAKPLNLRTAGYDAGAAGRHWGALDAHARGIERRFMEMDLVFPLVYGAAFTAALLLAWGALGRPFHPAWLLAPVAVTLAADWTENLVQLGQLHRFGESGAAGLQPGRIQLASAATRVKLLFFVGSAALVAALASLMAYRAIARHP